MYKIISGEVLHWKKLGRTIWFPTANIFLEPWIIPDWTYKINVIIDWEIFAWVWAYLSVNKLFESHIFNFSQDIYQKNIEVVVLYKIRNNKKFENFEELKSQIQIDKEIAKDLKDTVLTFWTFDIFHEGHKNYLFNAKKYWDKLVTIVATDENVFKFKQKYPLYDENYRKNEVLKAWISDEVVIWKTTNPMSWLSLYNPKVICLWYDQKWFSDYLNDYIKNNNLNIEIIRLHSYKPEIYKSTIIKNKLGI